MKLEACPFDSDHYRLKIGRLVPESNDGEASLREGLDAGTHAGYAVLFLRLERDDQLRPTVEAMGHTAVDTLVTSTLRGRVAAPVPPASVTFENHPRLEDPADVASVARMTAEVMKTSHLHADPRLPMEQTRALFAAWAKNDVTGRAQRTFLARAGREIVGYITVLDRGSSLMIDLVAVDDAWRGQGIGAALLHSVVAWIGDRDVVATVGTQRENPALGLYARHGFVPTEEHVTYHLWLT